MKKNKIKISIIPILESDKLLMQDFNMIEELSTYIRKGSSFQAEEGSNDDLVTCLVIFAWLSNQRYFKELTDQDVRARLYQDQQHAIEQDMAPFGFVEDGLEEDVIIDDKGERWVPVHIRKGDMP